jgi:predicted dehydrogenase
MNNRRSFLKTSLAASSALYLPSTWSRAQGANTDIRVGIIGCDDPGKNAPGGRGRYHLKEVLGKIAKGNSGLRLTAICDVDQDNLDAAKVEIEKAHLKAEYFQDFRKMLESKELDAVIIATPNHTHSWIAAWALEAGKHVYVEKPVSHNIWEGRQLVNIAKKHAGKLICQHGMQRRNDPVWQQVIDYVASGKVGKPLLSRGLCYKPRQSINKVAAPWQPAATVNYDLWCGPREVAPVKRTRLHYDWHWQWEFGNGDIGNQGPHQLDVARWLVGDPQQGPTRVISLGGRFGYEDDATTANTQIAFFDFKPVPVLFEVRGLPDSKMNFKGRTPSWKKTGVQVGNVLHCEGAYIAEGMVYDNATDQVIEKFKPNDGAGHQDAFFASIRSGKIDAHHEVTTGHLSASLAHMANVSLRLGQEVSSEAVKDQIKGTPSFAETYDKLTEHLANNDVDLTKSKLMLGAMLNFDGASELFTGDLAKEANALARGTYRPGYELPKV